ncbi:GDSL-type esterase/lipase family protein [Vibrio sinaloensis]|nr:GDSL-type esterase/lipase family protein [Vibrio sinaloensis]
MGGPWHDALPNIPLSNRGLAGDTTAGMVQRLETTTLHQPKLVCVMAGINDLAQGYSVEHISHNYAKKMVDFFGVRRTSKFGFNQPCMWVKEWRL